ncbi:MAG: ABC transporter ATP-binding protein [Candidatus Heimdallarchaeota archaeon]|nr:ABC transporter ATP-binding protein [Candidatus Heimdallarchaeota archaeon]
MIICKDLLKVFWDPVTDVKVSALRGLDIYVKSGEVASIIGPSGSGKTTLIKILCGNEKPSGGSVYIDDENIAELSERKMRKFRYNKMGIVNQFIHQNLLSHLTVEQNIRLPMRFKHVAREKAVARVDELLKILHLDKIRYNPVTKISGGEAVRASIGVALAKDTPIVLADEPTGQLDTTNTNHIIDTFRDLNENLGTTILVVTHDLRFRNAFKKSYIIRDGRLVGINADINRGELDFILKPQESTLQSIIDGSQFLRLPDEVVITGAFENFAEFMIHPSKQFSLLFNPNQLNQEEIYEILNDTKYELDDYSARNDRTKVSFREIQPIIEQQFLTPTKIDKVINVKNLFKSFQIGDRKHKVLKNINFKITKGDFVVISGKSGAGKTTLMNVVSGIESPDSGIIEINGFDVTDSSRREVASFRFNNIALINQVNNLFEQYTISENMIIPRIFSKNKSLGKVNLKKTAESVEIDHKIKQYAAELSAGERQRAALAIALSKRSPILFADEPTANLDSRLARNIVALLMETSQRYGTTVLMSTHDLSLVRPGFRLIRLEDGEIMEDVRVTKAKLKGIIELYLGITIDEEEEFEVAK